MLLALGCDPPTRPNNLVSLTNSDNGRTIAVLVGDDIDITLGTIGPGEYGPPVVSSSSIRFLGEFSPGAPTPGGVRQLFRFEAVAVGPAQITFPHINRGPLSPIPFVVGVEVR